MSDAPLYPSEDGPGAGGAVEVTVRVMVGPERSTVLVERQGEPASLYETRDHGHEADGLGAAVEAAVRAGLAVSTMSSDQSRGGPAIDHSHRVDREGHPKRPLDDAMTARHMMTRGFTEDDVRHVLGYMPELSGMENRSHVHSPQASERVPPPGRDPSTGRASGRDWERARLEHDRLHRLYGRTPAPPASSGRIMRSHR